MGRHLVAISPDGTNSCNFHANLETKGKLDLLLRKFFHASLFSHTIRQSCNLCDRCWYRDIFDVHPLAWSSQIFYGRWGEERGVRLVIVRDTSRSPVVNGLDVTSPYLHVLMADATPVFILLCLFLANIENGWTDLANFGLELFVEVQGRFKRLTLAINSANILRDSEPL
uniref:SFRICE_033998 n=1 Tax=Spodoptera frugiperda TaxID=7108 RepID=A0A2H1VYN8_SPOFR